MESVVALVAVWISLREMIKSRDRSTLISDVLREWQDKETVESLAAQRCENRSGEKERRAEKVDDRVANAM